MKIVWNGDRTIGIAIDLPDDVDSSSLAYELRKGSANCLSLIDPTFQEAWSEMTAQEGCTIEDLITS